MVLLAGPLLFGAAWWSLDQDRGFSLRLASDAGDVIRVRQLLDQFPNIVNTHREQLVRTNQVQYSSSDRSIELSQLFSRYGLNAVMIPVRLAVAGGDEPELPPGHYNSCAFGMHEASGWAALHFSCLAGHTEVVKTLIHHGAATGSRDGVGETPLFLTLPFTNLAVAQILLENGANTDVANNNGDTPLTRAAFLGLTNFVDLLLDHGADVNFVATNSVSPLAGWTPLHAAACGGRAGIALRLIQKGARLEARDRWGRTPLAIAAQVRKTNLVELLRSFGARE